MRVLNAVRLGAAVVAAFAAGVAAAATIVVTFPELNGAADRQPVSAATGYRRGPDVFDSRG